ncbi:hypothetical protein ACV311_14905 [Clostridium perfringens]|uniref:HNH endonuclease n=1 Tax=Clostridium perfringens TaxID=1502 RepID=A0AAE8K622_CLOPF|nr:hypothetical protein [Clostridium perfringens]MDK3000683.1 hypothetical protein [Clostridium perfringens]RQN22840.1 hypothetical protein EHZ11_15100 [Clostridium perfringens]
MSEKRKCIFCDEIKLSKEHIFAQWLLKELDIYDSNITMSHTNFIGIPLSNRKHPYSKLVNGLVCEKCNNGWMSQLEGDCQEHIINFMNMKEIKIELDFLEKHYYTIAKWAFKNAILLNNATNYRQLVPKEHYTALYSGIIPEGIFIDLAFCKSESKLEWRQTPGGLVIRDVEIPVNLNVIRYIITFQVKHLLIKVAFYESSENVFYEDKGAIRIFPNFGLCETVKIFDNIDAFDVHGLMHEYRSTNE